MLNEMKKWMRIADKIPGWTAPALACLIVIFGMPQGYVGQEHDDAIYLLASQSLAEGKYHAIYSPGSPRITQTTPGFPALLTPIAALFPFHLLAFQLWCGIFLILTIWLYGWWLKTRCTPSTATGLVLAFSLSPLVIARGGVLMPEIPFLLLSLLLLMAWDRKVHPLWLGVLMAISYLVRPAALAVWVAVELTFFLQKRWKAMGSSMVFPALTLALWSLWCRGEGGVQEFTELKTMFVINFDNILAIFGHNFLRLVTLWGETTLPLKWASSVGAVGMGTALWVGAGIGFARSWRQKPIELWPIMLGTQIVMHLFWPWWYDRYFILLLPFLLVCLTQIFSSRSGVAFLIGIFVTILPFSQTWLFLTLGGKVTPPLTATYQWIQQKTPPETAFTSLFHARDLLYAKRVFFPPPSSLGLDGPLARWNVRYVLWEERADLGFSNPENQASSWKNKNARQLKNPRLFAPVFWDPTGKAILYKRLGVEHSRATSPLPLEKPGNK